MECLRRAVPSCQQAAGTAATATPLASPAAAGVHRGKRDPVRRATETDPRYLLDRNRPRRVTCEADDARLPAMTAKGTGGVLGSGRAPCARPPAEPAGPYRRRVNPWSPGGFPGAPRRRATPCGRPVTGCCPGRLARDQLNSLVAFVAPSVEVLSTPAVGMPRAAVSRFGRPVASGDGGSRQRL